MKSVSVMRQKANGIFEAFSFKGGSLPFFRKTSNFLAQLSQGESQRV
ncbi:hypothetical protein [Pseudalkalibacillus caeni]|nr:hypothetical protein [Pseudalkalibacillus caeni]